MLSNTCYAVLFSNGSVKLSIDLNQWFVTGQASSVGQESLCTL